MSGKLLSTTKLVIAWLDGNGDAKICWNYAPCIKPQLEAAEKGYQQNLWLFNADDEITEVGTMNCFVLLKNEQGGKVSFFLHYYYIIIILYIYIFLHVLL